MKLEQTYKFFGLRPKNFQVAARKHNNWKKNKLAAKRLERQQQP